MHTCTFFLFVSPSYFPILSVATHVPEFLFRNQDRSPSLLYWGKYFCYQFLMFRPAIFCFYLRVFQFFFSSVRCLFPFGSVWIQSLRNTLLFEYLKISSHLFFSDRLFLSFKHRNTEFGPCFHRLHLVFCLTSDTQFLESQFHLKVSLTPFSNSRLLFNLRFLFLQVLFLLCELLLQLC